MAVENLLKAHGEGKHHIWMPIDVVQEFTRVEALGYFSKRVLNELVGQVNERRFIHNDFLFYASVDFVDKHRLQFLEGVLYVGYHQFLDSSSTQESVLLTENDLDGEAFVWGAKTYLHKHRLSGLNVTLEIQPGGGNTTINSFQRLNRGKRFFACIIDSDKEHPKASLGTTAKRFNKVDQGFQDKRYFEILSHHEIENLIPFSIIKSVAGDLCKAGAVFDQQFYLYRAYPDHKLGLSVGQAESHDRTYTDNYWDCFSKLEAESIICPKFGDDLLKRCIDFMSTLSPKVAIQCVDEDFDSEWMRISKLVASWGVGGRGLRS
ncbi:hypothetical protein IFT48_07380 [Pseudomonas fluorescens]|uniref:hypothetical protein n=1 Tax=Pseudomonas fluorescens TaxID=294 RepID=UPI001908D826|nr:hypothetical protein [Pseudomonas fluorescens]MBD8089803.1 hypothetical protein [Pseudomonas fluorescens]MBD8719168.1 hypothetical protein [Pseudomonas fluorescens]